MTATSPNFVLLDSTRPDIATMLQARDAVDRRSWSFRSLRYAITPVPVRAAAGSCSRLLAGTARLAREASGG